MIEALFIKMKYAAWFRAQPGYENHRDPIQHVSFVFYSFPLICSEVNSNPSEKHRSKQVSMLPVENSFSASPLIVKKLLI